MLLISLSGEGDADRSTDLVDQLVNAYTVVTYDRRACPAAPSTTPPAE
ncbi:hypothetical protein [Nonomuraea turcica]|nr:hypothetical protein [Nonomuraea sp. G32]MDP4500939.1 hypothetical protein [Nonomuraea sp. G32]